MLNFIKPKKGLQNKNSENLSVTYLFDNYDKNLLLFKEIFQNDDTVVFHEFLLSDSDNTRVCIIYVMGMVDLKKINDNIVGAALNSSQIKINSKNPIQTLKKRMIHFGNIREFTDVDQLVGSVLYGDTLLLAEDCPSALIIDSKGYMVRGISESLSENVVRGPRDAFTECLTVNMSLVRRRINNSNLKFNFRTIGTEAKTKVCVCYIEGMHNEKILQELYCRLEKIKLNAILESGYIEELIKDNPLSIFTTVGHTERPDKVVANLLEGRIAIFVDGTPIVLTVPFLFTEYFQVGEDYYNKFYIGSINRALRWLAFFMSTSVTALYVALTAFQQEMIPTPLLLNISASRVDVPFPTVIEIFLMTIVFEILREGGSRLPASVGPTISYVGAVVIGDAAVNAKFVSAPVVIIVALTGLSNFLIPKLMGTLSIVRLILLFMSGILGIYGYLFGMIGLFIHLLSMYSFGVPYMLNVSTLNKYDVKDTLIRIPWWMAHLRQRQP